MNDGTRIIIHQYDLNHLSKLQNRSVTISAMNIDVLYQFASDRKRTT